jgi:hypothetical protein
MKTPIKPRMVLIAPIAVALLASLALGMRGIWHVNTQSPKDTAGIRDKPNVCTYRTNKGDVISVIDVEISDGNYLIDGIDSRLTSDDAISKLSKVNFTSIDISGINIIWENLTKDDNVMVKIIFDWARSKGIKTYWEPCRGWPTEIDEGLREIPPDYFDNDK